MGKALYRKYRSRSFAEVIGQEHITKTLKNAIKQGRISHAYLFTGPRGTGKTSVARILAHEVNRLPYRDDTVHLDIIEIDAASNRRIEEVRDLREKVHIAPAAAKYKVYIIDEVHMLTKEAFNALLKTLEEPPEHCIFILATTEAHKLPETITSRTQRYSFKPIASSLATEHLKNIANKEKIDIDAGALDLLAQFGQGSFRDSISVLDQLSALDKKISEKEVRQILGIPDKQLIDRLYNQLKTADTAGVLGGLNGLIANGANPANIAKEIAKFIRNDLIVGTADDNLINLLRELIDVSSAPSATDKLEIALLSASNSAAQRQTRAPETNTLNTGSADNQSLQRATESIPIHKPSKAVKSGKPEVAIEYWPEILNQVRRKSESLYTALRLAVPEKSGGKLLLQFEFSLHQKKVNQPKAKSIIAASIEEVTGQFVETSYVVNKQLVIEQRSSAKKSQSMPVKAISNIFGDVEMLES